MKIHGMKSSVDFSEFSVIRFLRLLYPPA